MGVLSKWRLFQKGFRNGACRNRGSLENFTCLCKFTKFTIFEIVPAHNTIFGIVPVDYLDCARGLYGLCPAFYGLCPSVFRIVPAVLMWIVPVGIQDCARLGLCPWGLDCAQVLTGTILNSNTSFANQVAIVKPYLAIHNTYRSAEVRETNSKTCSDFDPYPKIVPGSRYHYRLKSEHFELVSRTSRGSLGTVYVGYQYYSLNRKLDKNLGLCRSPPQHNPRAQSWRYFRFTKEQPVFLKKRDCAWFSGLCPGIDYHLKLNQ